MKSFAEQKTHLPILCCCGSLLLFTLETVTRNPAKRQLKTPAKSTGKHEQQLILDLFALPKFEGITTEGSNPNKASVNVKTVQLPLHSSAGSCLNRPQLCLCRHRETCIVY